MRNAIAHSRSSNPAPPAFLPSGPTPHESKAIPPWSVDLEHQIDDQDRQRRHLRAIQLVTDELLRRLDIDGYSSSLVLALTGRTDSLSNRDAVEQWVSLVLTNDVAPDLRSLARQLRNLLDDGVESWG